MTLGYVSTCWVACNLTRHIFNKFNILMHFFSNIQISINISQYAVFDTIYISLEVGLDFKNTENGKDVY